MVRLPRAGTQASYPSKQALTELLVERIVQGVQKDGLLGHVVRAVTVPALSHRHGQCDLGRFLGYGSCSALILLLRSPEQHRVACCLQGVEGILLPLLMARPH